MSLSVATSASPPGAGRSIDMALDIPNTSWKFPNTQGFAQSASLQGVSRIGGALTAQVLGDNGGWSSSGIANAKTGLYRGRQCWRFPNTNGASASVNAEWVIAPFFTQPVYNCTQDDPRLNWRVRVVVAAGACGASATAFDNGLIFTADAGIGQTVVNKTGPGFGVSWGANGLPAFLTSKGGGVGTATPLNAAAADQDWHSVEVRMFGAQLGSEASLSVVYDGTTVIQKSWGAGSDLPDYGTTANVMGFLPQFLVGATAFPAFLYLSEMRVIAAPTFSALF